MPIIYTCIARAKDATVLVESSAPELGGNAPQITLALLHYIRDHPEILEEGARKTWSQRNDATADFFSGLIDSLTGGNELLDGTEHYFHVLRKDGVIYSCLSDDSDPREQNVNFDFLVRTQSEFTHQFRKGRIARGNAYSMDKEFGANIRTALHYYNINHAKLAQEKKVKKVLAEIEDLKDVIGKNIQLVLRQTADLEKMVKKSEQATESTLVFRKKATQVRNKLWRRHKASGCGLILSVALLIYIILAMTCGWGLTGCRVSEK